MWLVPDDALANTGRDVIDNRDQGQTHDYTSITQNITGKHGSRYAFTARPILYI